MSEESKRHELFERRLAAFDPENWNDRPRRKRSEIESDLRAVGKRLSVALGALGPMGPIGTPCADVLDTVKELCATAARARAMQPGELWVESVGVNFSAVRRFVHYSRKGAAEFVGLSSVGGCLNGEFPIGPWGGSHFYALPIAEWIAANPDKPIPEITPEVGDRVYYWFGGGGRYVPMPALIARCDALGNTLVDSDRGFSAWRPRSLVPRSGHWCYPHESPTHPEEG